MNFKKNYNNNINKLYLTKNNTILIVQENKNITLVLLFIKIIF